MSLSMAEHPNHKPMGWMSSGNGGALSMDGPISVWMGPYGTSGWMGPQGLGHDIDGPWAWIAPWTLGMDMP